MYSTKYNINKKIVKEDIEMVKKKFVFFAAILGFIVGGLICTVLYKNIINYKTYESYKSFATAGGYWMTLDNVDFEKLPSKELYRGVTEYYMWYDLGFLKDVNLTYMYYDGAVYVYKENQLEAIQFYSWEIFGEVDIHRELHYDIDAGFWENFFANFQFL